MILSVQNASFAYKRNNNVFEDVSLEVKGGEILAVLGANGSGKTTLLRCIMGFLRFRSGGAFLDGERIYGMSAEKLWRRIAYVPQARGAYSSLDVRNMILLGTASRIGVFSSPGEREYALADSIAERLGITHLLSKKCSEISGGEMQMVLVSRALAAEPSVLILDEPESNLDFSNQLIVLNTISSLAEDGMCCIFNTHYPDHALSRADKALLLTDGRAIFGSADDIVTAENIRRAFGVNALIGEINDGGRTFKSVIPTSLAD